MNCDLWRLYGQIFSSWLEPNFTPKTIATSDCRTAACVAYFPDRSWVVA